MAKVLPSTPDGQLVPEWVMTATAEDGAGYDRADGALGEWGLFRFEVTFVPDTGSARVEAFIADNTPENQLDLLRQVQGTINIMVSALEAQINKEGAS